VPRDCAERENCYPIAIGLYFGRIIDNESEFTDNRQQITDNRQQITDNRQQTTDNPIAIG
jgi:hypothetical protein